MVNCEDDRMEKRGEEEEGRKGGREQGTQASQRARLPYTEPSDPPENRGLSNNSEQRRAAGMSIAWWCRGLGSRQTIYEGALRGPGLHYTPCLVPLTHIVRSLAPSAVFISYSDCQRQISLVHGLPFLPASCLVSHTRSSDVRRLLESFPSFLDRLVECQRPNILSSAVLFLPAPFLSLLLP